MELNNVFWLLGIFVVVVVLFGVGSCRFMEKSSPQDDDGKDK
jgi:hypothetical protein